MQAASLKYNVLLPGSLAKHALYDNVSRRVHNQTIRTAYGRWSWTHGSKPSIGNNEGTTLVSGQHG